jgi:threonyl-tRNA synthetase
MSAVAEHAEGLGDDLSAPSDFVSRMRHTTAPGTRLRVMAQAVRELFPDAKMATRKRVPNPVIENGFYYDFDLPRLLTPDDLAAIEERMARIVKENTMYRWEKTGRGEVL